MIPERIEREIVIEAPVEVVWAGEPGRDIDGAEADELWSAVTDPTRRRMLDILLDGGGTTATILAGELPITRQAVAKHLAVLDRAGLVEGVRRGREVRYVIRPQRLDAATRSMAQVAADWEARLSAIRRLAESVARAHAGEHRTTGGNR